ncbi:IS5 family transposase [Corallococcus exiguus]|nr:IS5 family transposase [Corallococcus sp. AB032C]NNB83993.1 IS5 family transposase [Corallococcus exiguus]NNB92218.1 IS5 family transposase [Corallococcus exiguus]NNB92349.1 IS5 family transposase [Corallococcus exiguus]RKH71119.1 IS5 family transposase [Corallococcus sp. AB032C]RKH77217.1 IS5 family transposase [Corallococcus sp. AB032C]
MHRHELTDEQWKQLEPLIPARRGPRTKKGDRQFVNAVLWRVKTGAPWRDLPERYGPWKTVYNRFGRWATRGVWEGLFKSLQLQVDDVGSLLDATIIRAHQDAAGAKGGADAMLWAVLEEAFLPRSTPCAPPRANRSK